MQTESMNDFNAQFRLFVFATFQTMNTPDFYF